MGALEWGLKATLRNVHFLVLTFSLLTSEDLRVFLSFLSDRSVFVPSDECAENTAIALRKSRKSQKSSRISKEEVNKVLWPF